MYNQFLAIFEILVGLFADLFNAFNQVMIDMFSLDLKGINLDIKILSDTPIVSISLFNALVLVVVTIFTWLFFRFFIRLFKRFLGVFNT